jgi:hypothetical protein
MEDGVSFVLLHGEKSRADEQKGNEEEPVPLAFQPLAVRVERVVFGNVAVHQDRTEHAQLAAKQLNLAVGVVERHDMALLTLQ